MLFSIFWRWRRSLAFPCIFSLKAAEGAFVHIEVTGEIIVFDLSDQIRLIFHKIAKPIVSVHFSHLLSLSAEQIIFLEDICPVPVKGRVLLKGLAEFFECNAPENTIFHAFDVLFGGRLSEEAADRNKYLAFTHKIFGSFFISLDPVSPDETFFDKRDTFSDVAWTDNNFAFPGPGCSDEVAEERFEGGFHCGEFVQCGDEFFHVFKMRFKKGR
jgi:hypothetical protein